MKTQSDTQRVSGALVALMTALLLTQCSLPPRQAWQYIRSNGLLTYLNYSAGQARPPFGSRTAYNQRYAARSYRPSNTWYSNWGSGMPNRVHYAPVPSTQNRHYSAAPPYKSSRPAPRPRVSEPAPRVSMPVDEPAPQIVRTDTSSQSQGGAPSTPKTDAPPSVPRAAADLPYGSAVPGRANMVNSPYAGKTQLVDVSGMGPGQTVKCPYTGKLFKVPPTQQASNNAESRLEPKTDAAKPSDTKSEQ